MAAAVLVNLAYSGASVAERDDTLIKPGFMWGDRGLDESVDMLAGAPDFANKAATRNLLDATLVTLAADMQTVFVSQDLARRQAQSEAAGL